MCLRLLKFDTRVISVVAAASIVELIFYVLANRS
jgi:hypothetical protein